MEDIWAEAEAEVFTVSTTQSKDRHGNVAVGMGDQNADADEEASPTAGRAPTASATPGVAAASQASHEEILMKDVENDFKMHLKLI